MTVEKVGAFLGIFILKNYICKVVFSKYTFHELYRQTEGIETFGGGHKGLQRQVTGCLWGQFAKVITISVYQFSIGYGQTFSTRRVEKPKILLTDKNISIQRRRIIT